jgi:hypothetical protein
MRLIEFLDQDDLNTAYYDPAEDKVGVRKPSDTRKVPKLTLKILNRLKKIRALRRLERLKREDLLTIMYAPADDAGGGMGGGMGAPPAF